MFTQPRMHSEAHSSSRTPAFKESGFILSAVSLSLPLFRPRKSYLPIHGHLVQPRKMLLKPRSLQAGLAGLVGQSQSTQNTSPQGNDETNGMLTVSLTSHLPRHLRLSQGTSLILILPLGLMSEKLPGRGSECMYIGVGRKKTDFTLKSINLKILRGKSSHKMFC